MRSTSSWGRRASTTPTAARSVTGTSPGEVTLGSRRVAVERPRLKSVDGREEVQLASYRHFADRDTLIRVVLERMLAGVSTRRFPRTQEPVGEQVEAEGRSISKSAVRRQLRRAWADSDHDRALRALQALSPRSSTAPTPAPPARCAGMEETLRSLASVSAGR